LSLNLRSDNIAREIGTKLKLKTNLGIKLNHFDT